MALPAGFPRLTFILGGARSGKSRHAELLLAQVPPPWRYIATAQAHDDEMRTRIAQHRARRGADWRTIEAPIDLVGAINDTAGPLLVECLTLWLTNVMLGGGDVGSSCDALEAALVSCPHPMVIVANEVGLGIVPDNALARAFRDAAGLLHQRIAARADQVLFMVAGLPLVVKAP